MFFEKVILGWGVYTGIYTSSAPVVVQSTDPIMPIPDHRAEDEFGKNVKHQFKMQKNVSKGKVIEVAETLLMRAQNPASMAPYTAAEASMVAADIVNERKVMRIKAHQDPVTSHEIDPVLWSLLHEAPDLQTVIQARPVVRRGRRNNEAMANGAQPQQVQAANGGANGGANGNTNVQPAGNVAPITDQSNDRNVRARLSHLEARMTEVQEEVDTHYDTFSANLNTLAAQITNGDS